MSDLTKVEGFEDLNRKLKQLPDKVKRQEVLKIQKRLAAPIIKAYSQALPVGKKDKIKNGTRYPAGSLSKSVKAETVPARKVGGNPSIAIRPGKKGKHNAYYKFMVVRKGFKGSGAGSRKGANNVVDQARDRALATTGAQATKQAEDKTALYIQKQINKL
jgi:hypothetical protein